MKDKYLLQVCRDKFCDYIMKAIICPDSLMGEECHIDTQSKYGNILIVSNGIINDLDEFEEILIEIEINQQDLKPTNNQNIFCITKPIPISDIIRIYTQSSKESEHILRKLDTNQKGFIPKEFLEVKKDFEIYQLPDIEDIEIVDYSKQINQYNKYLGMLAYIKNSEFYYPTKYKEPQKFSSEYMDILENNNFTDSLKDDNDTKFVNYLMTNKRLNKDYINLLIEQTPKKVIKKHLTTLINDPLEKLNILKKLARNKDEIYFYICFVYINSDKYSSKPSTLKNLLKKHIPYKKSKKALAYLGLYYGYEMLDANETITINRYKEIVKNTKFKLDIDVEKQTISKIYQKVFLNGNNI